MKSTYMNRNLSEQTCFFKLIRDLEDTLNEHNYVSVMGNGGGTFSFFR